MESDDGHKKANGNFHSRGGHTALAAEASNKIRILSSDDILVRIQIIILHIQHNYRADKM